MKNQRIFPGVILIGFGIYFYLQQENIEFFQDFHSWPTLMAIVGIAFLVQGYWGKDYDSILPGAIFLGLGVHFHIAGRLEIWPGHLGAFILIIALGFLLRYQKTGTGLIHGILFLALAALLLFYGKMSAMPFMLKPGIASLWQFWPAILILAGVFLLLVKKKK
ncbi:LiaI-LiaF-like domain-containing protein [Mesobacillus zeae]|uniref:LiaI-LiaF-like transmembrane region domain-containing protein n=1 Tax=Mesobacillus zeae TaxID=1917180 RepID=A0A398B5N4_9BACI|nr:DUF5668 domain-containing protein [Mesobacillus zeae]RID83250.1 hypothetical protein D1970_17205 [Mesobacillus zeae]